MSLCWPDEPPPEELPDWAEGECDACREPVSCLFDDPRDGYALCGPCSDEHRPPLLVTDFRDHGVMS